MAAEGGGMTNDRRNQAAHSVHGGIGGDRPVVEDRGNRGGSCHHDGARGHPWNARPPAAGEATGGRRRIAGPSRRRLNAVRSPMKIAINVAAFIAGAWCMAKARDWADRNGLTFW